MLPDPFRTARDIAYLSLGLLTSVVAMAVWIVALSLSLTPRDPDRRAARDHRLGLRHALDGRTRPPQRCTRLRPAGAGALPHRTARARSAGASPRRSATRRSGATSAWLITHSVVGLAFGIVAITLVATVAGLATLPIWFWSLPDGLEMGLYDADTLPWAIITAFLAAPLAWVTVWVIRGLAKFHASLAVELLGRRR